MELTLIKSDVVKVYEDTGTCYAWFKIENPEDMTDEEIKNEAAMEANMWYSYRGPGQRFYQEPYGKINKRRTKVLVTQFTGMDI